LCYILFSKSKNRNNYNYIDDFPRHDVFFVFMKQKFIFWFKNNIDITYKSSYISKYTDNNIIQLCVK
jgi:hypothetical protein